MDAALPGNPGHPILAEPIKSNTREERRCFSNVYYVF